MAGEEADEEAGVDATGRRARVSSQGPSVTWLPAAGHTRAPSVPPGSSDGSGDWSGAGLAGVKGEAGKGRVRLRSGTPPPPPLTRAPEIRLGSTQAPTPHPVSPHSSSSARLT